jgi:hypothetical protein
MGENMAKAGRPLGKLHQEDVRRKIQTSQLINRLTDHALGMVDLEATQVRAIEILLKKSIPDLSSMELMGEGGGPVQLQEVRRVIVDPRDGQK